MYEMRQYVCERQSNLWKGWRNPQTGVKCSRFIVCVNEKVGGGRKQQWEINTYVIVVWPDELVLLLKPWTVRSWIFSNASLCWFELVWDLKQQKELWSSVLQVFPAPPADTWHLLLFLPLAYMLLEKGFEYIIRCCAYFYVFNNSHYFFSSLRCHHDFFGCHCICSFVHIWSVLSQASRSCHAFCADIPAYKLRFFGGFSRADLVNALSM